MSFKAGHLLLAILLLSQQTVASKQKVLVIGLDGATWSIVEDWIKQGFLPNLAKLRGEGSWGNLTSIIPFVSPVAWPSFMTGDNPGRHGIYGFQQCRAGEYEPYIPLGSSIKAPTLWKILSENGRKVVVMNVQMTYPPESVNGVIIGGLMSPDIAVYPPELTGWVREQGYIIEGRGYVNTPKKEFLESLYNSSEKRTEVALGLMDKVPDWDFFMMLYSETDRIQHYLWKDMEEGGEYENAILDYYKTVDGQLGQLVEKAGENTTIFIISDHGFTRQKKKVYIDYFLKENGFISTKKSASNLKNSILLRISGLLKRTGLNEVIVKIMVALGGKPGDIQPPKIEVDYDKTTAFTCSYYTGQIYLNQKLDEKEKAEITDDIIRKLGELRDPETGEKMVKEVHKKEELYHGGALAEAPDILIVPEDGYWIVGGFNYPQLIQEGDRETGRHDLEGIIIVSGENVKAGQVISGARLIDVAPTVLSLFGIEPDMDGRPLKEAFY